MFSAACFLLTAAMLAWIIRYRVQIHIEYQPRTQKRRRTRMRSREATAVDLDSDTLDTLTYALISLGATKTEAKKAARRALVELPKGTSDELLRVAIQEATRKGLS